MNDTHADPSSFWFPFLDAQRSEITSEKVVPMPPTGPSSALDVGIKEQSKLGAWKQIDPLSMGVYPKADDILSVPIAVVFVSPHKHFEAI